MEDTTKNTSRSRLVDWRSLGPPRPWVWLSKTANSSLALNGDWQRTFYILWSFSVQLLSRLPAHERTLLKWQCLKCKFHAPSVPTPTSRAPLREGSIICKAGRKASLAQNNENSHLYGPLIKLFFFLYPKMRRLFNPFNPTPQLTGILLGSISTTYLY